jgi:hypothetical protein
MVCRVRRHAISRSCVIKYCLCNVMTDLTLLTPTVTTPTHFPRCVVSCIDKAWSGRSEASGRFLSLSCACPQGRALTTWTFCGILRCVPSARYVSGSFETREGETGPTSSWSLTRLACCCATPLCKSRRPPGTTPAMSHTIRTTS